MPALYCNVIPENDVIKGKQKQITVGSKWSNVADGGPTLIQH